MGSLSVVSRCACLCGVFSGNVLSYNVTDTQTETQQKQRRVGGRGNAWSCLRELGHAAEAKQPEYGAHIVEILINPPFLHNVCLSVHFAVGLQGSC